MRSLLISFLCLAICAGARAAGPEGNLGSVLNAFIASIAKDNPELKTSIALWTPDAPIPDGHQVGRSKTMGLYTFRPKAFSELTADEKAAVMKHPQLKAFIVSVRNSRIYPAISAANPAGNVAPGWAPVEGDFAPTEIRVRIDPEEMLQNRPTVLHATETKVRK